MNIISSIVQVGKAVIVLIVISFVLYCTVVGVREFRMEDMVRETERQWDRDLRYSEELEEEEEDEDDEEWFLVKRRRRW